MGLQIVVPYYENGCSKNRWTAGQEHLLLQLDVYRVHLSSAFLDWIKEHKYSNVIHIVYVPGGTTSELQVHPR